MMVRLDEGALRLRLMQESHEERREAKRDAHDLRDRALELKRTQVTLETDAEEDSVGSQSAKSLGRVGGSVLRFLGVLLSTATYGVSVAVGEIGAQGVSYGVQKGFENRDQAIADKRQDGGILAAQAATIDAQAERLEQAAESERRLSRGLASGQERMQRELRRVQDVQL